MEVVFNFFANTKGPGTIFQAAGFVEFLDEFFSFVIWHKLAKFHRQTVFTYQVIQWNVFLVSGLGIWWRHEIWKCRILKFDFLESSNYEHVWWGEFKLHTRLLIDFSHDFLFIMGLTYNLSIFFFDKSITWVTIGEYFTSITLKILH